MTNKTKEEKKKKGKKNLAEGSLSYHEEAHIYNRFSQVEDALDLTIQYLTPLVKGKHVLDVGCGTGKYASFLAPAAKTYCGIDISPYQIWFASKRTERIGNVSLMCTPAESIDLPSESIDMVISTWVIGTIDTKERKRKSIEEAARTLKKGGSIYLVENDIGGDFEYIRGRMPDTSRTKEYNDWLENEMGFKPDARFDTFFGFTSLEEAKSIIGSIWGDVAAGRVKGKNMGHKVIIYKWTKN